MWIYLQRFMYLFCHVISGTCFRIYWLCKFYYKTFGCDPSLSHMDGKSCRLKIQKSAKRMRGMEEANYFFLFLLHPLASFSHVISLEAARYWGTDTDLHLFTTRFALLASRALLSKAHSTLPVWITDFVARKAEMGVGRRVWQVLSMWVIHQLTFVL